MKTAKMHKIEPVKDHDKAPLDVAPMMVRAPQPPDGMKPDAQEFWRKKCIHLRQIGRLHAIDLDALECLANLYADVKRTRKDVDNALTSDLFSKHQRSHIEALKQFKDLCRDFGFTPASRGKIKVAIKENAEDDEFEQI